MFKQYRTYKTFETRPADRFSLLVFLILFVSLAPLPSHASEQYRKLLSELESCSSVVKELDRVKCFDLIIANHSKYKIESTKERLNTASKTKSIKVPERDIAKAEDYIDEKEDLTAKKALEKANAGKEHLKQKEDSEQDKVLEFVLINTRKDKLDRWRFYFENGQIWRQSSPGRISAIKEFPVKSALSSGLFGSYRLTVGNSKRSIKVKRIK